MKTCKYARSLALALVILATSLPCVARDSQTITLEDSVSLSGVQIAPGVYKIAWESHSAEATVTVLKGKHVIATAQARWVERNVRFTRTALVYSIGKDGSRRIIEIRLAGMHQALVFDADPASGATALAIPACATVSPTGHAAPGSLGDGECVQFVTEPISARPRAFTTVWADESESWPPAKRRQVLVMRKFR